ncbi:S26 family signal peptidase [Streptomyces lavendulae]|uniref:S26 family signal peptidase n=1 Tax=Streptomyces lavendulae TaxID=1914 RepID=UPI00373AED51
MARVCCGAGPRPDSPSLPISTNVAVARLGASRALASLLRFAARAGDRGDVALLSTGRAARSARLGGRVLAVNGDRLPYRAGNRTLILNGNPLTEPYLPPKRPPSAAAFDILVPEGQVVALGGNRVEPHERDFPEGRPGTFDAADIRGRADPKPNGRTGESHSPHWPQPACAEAQPPPPQLRS